MVETIQNLLAEQGLSLCAPIALSDCTVTKPYLLERHGIGMNGSAFIFAIPYHTPECESSSRNISRYAVGYDYHLFVRELSDKLIPALRAAFPDAKFALFADHSPIDEREAAAKAGLGIIGRNGLLITECYSSYIFLGEVITSLPLSKDQYSIGEIRGCENCGACLAACPLAQGKISECLSSLTQKKGSLSPEEQAAIANLGSAWGCDVCQQVCPHTKAAQKRGSLSSPLPFFKENPIPHLTCDILSQMTSEEFSSRAYAWRGREVILRNLDLLETNGTSI